MPIVPVCRVRFAQGLRATASLSMRRRTIFAGAALNDLYLRGCQSGKLAGCFGTRAWRLRGGITRRERCKDQPETEDQVDFDNAFHDTSWMTDRS